jgi:hypothetical protein
VTYNKPEFRMLGDAAQVIQNQIGHPKNVAPLELIPFHLQSPNPSYDLDE